MTVSNEKLEFFTKLSKIWQNFKDYSYLEGINLSQEQINIIEQEEDQLLIEGYAGTGKSLSCRPLKKSIALGQAIEAICG